MILPAQTAQLMHHAHEFFAKAERNKVYLFLKFTRGRGRLLLESVMQFALLLDPGADEFLRPVLAGTLCHQLPASTTFHASWHSTCAMS